MKILVVDDTASQREIASRLLKDDHDVVIVSGWSEAKELLTSYENPARPHDLVRNYDNPNAFDVVLTDMMMPGEKGANSGFGQPVAYGFIVAMLALRCGVQQVGVVSNANHHQDPVSWACDHIEGFNFEGRLTFFVGNSCPFMRRDREEVRGIDHDDSGLKDWREVLSRLTAVRK